MPGEDRPDASMRIEIAARRYLPDTRNSGWGTAMFFGRLLKAGYSGAWNHSSVNSPLSIRLTVASQKPSNSRFSFQYAASTRAPTRSVSQGLGDAAMVFSGLLVAAATGFASLGGLLSGEAVDVAEGAEDSAVAVGLMFVVCSKASFVSAAVVFAGVGDASAPDVLRT